MSRILARRWLAPVVFALLLSACGGGGGDSSGADPGAPAPLTVSVFPTNGASGVALDVILTATASAPLDPATVTAASFTLVEVGGGPVVGVISVSGATATFQPLIALNVNTQYLATLTGTVRSAAGTALSGGSQSLSFTTVTTPGAPVIGSATATGATTVSVSFAAPASNGGATITGYTVTSNPAGGVDSNAGSTGLSHVITGLNTGTPYTFTVTATNSAGTGPPSAPSNSVTPQAGAAVPGAPTGVVATAGDAQASVTFVAPGVTGSSAITGYSVSALIGGVPTAISASGGGSPIVVPGLTNGTAYTFVVTASNSVGAGPASAPSAPVTPAGLPGAPTAAAATAGNTQATVTFAAPASNGGSAITGYTVVSNPAGGVDTNAGSAGLSHFITGLINGTPYAFTVTASNAIGTGPPSAPTNSVTPSPTATAPGAPTGAAATAGNAQATVNFVAPALDGGSPVLSYTVTALVGGVPTGITASGGGTSIVVPGLTNGTAYTFNVRATNAVGTGAPSAVSNAVTPATVPGAPAAATATAGNAQATVSFTAPASNGGSAITGYTVTSNPAGGVDSNAGSPGLSHVITGLTNGITYTFSVTATNAVGTGAPSASTNSVTPTVATVPGAPTAATATAGNAQATLTFAAPASNGGSAITGYTVISSPPGGVDTNAGTTGLSHLITGLTNGIPYTFTVTATNAVGAGPASAASNAVVPATLPGPPQTVTAVGGDSQATVNFAPPASNGGATITGYRVTSNPGGVIAFGAGSPVTVPGLTNGVNYAFTVAATNSVGTGPESAFSNNVTPNLVTTAPSQPLAVTAVRGNGNATISFSAPASDGGSAITGYVVTSNPPGGTDLAAGTPGLIHTVSGLTNGVAYTFTVVATNGVGPSAPSAPSNSVTPATVPGAPTAVSAIAGDSQATVSFSAAPNNGEPVTLYTVFVCSPGCVAGPTTTTVTPVLVTGLVNGTNYTFTVRATNSVGNGPQSAASVGVTPNVSATVPGAPIGATATAGNTQATVTFLAPASTGGSPITGYTVTSSPAGGVDTNAGTTGLSHVITGLTNGVAYTFTVTATNAIGTGPASGASNTVTPATVPSAPAAPTAIAGNGQATVSFVPPANGGSAITSFRVRALIGGVDTGIFVVGAASPIVVTGLTNGQPYTFDVLATNDVGTGPDSPDSSPAVTPSSATVPGAPTAVTATAGNGQATINFTAGPDNGSAITTFTATSSPGDITGTVAGPAAAPIVVNGLTPGVAYTFTVTATNGIGVSPPSAASNSVTPVGAPGAPTAVSATAGNTQATVTFNAPASNGGSAIASYTVTSSPGNFIATGTGTSITYPPGSLANGTPFTFTVTATNAATFTSPPSAPSNSVIPTALATACSNTTPVVSAGTGRISLRAQASRVTGVSPLAVFFDATATTSTATTLPYHEIEYRWNFGDAASGTWPVGTRPGVSSKNTATGPLASHLYNLAPGDFTSGTATRTVSLTATDGVESATCSIQIVISDPDVQFASSTLCVSSSGNFAGCPAGATQLTSASFSDAINTTASLGNARKRILFRAGETFSQSIHALIVGAGPGHVGVFPAGGPRAIITGATSKIIFGNSVNHSFGDWRVTDLDFDGVNRTGGTSGVFAAGAARQITVHNSIFRNLNLGFNLSLIMLDSINSSSQLAPIWSEWYIGSNQFQANAQYALLVSMNNTAVLGNTVTGQLGQHAMRLEHGRKVIFSNNELTGTSNGTALTIRGWCFDPNIAGTRSAGNQFTLPFGSFSEQTVVSDNKLASGPGAPTVTYTAPNGTERPRLRDHLFERNWVISSTSGANVTSIAQRSTFRNNILDNSQAVGDFRVIEVARSEDPVSDDYFFYNNSAFTSAASSSVAFSIVDVNFTAARNLVVRNNLGSAPANTSGQTAAVRDFVGTSTIVQSNNSTSAQIRGASPLLVTPPTQPSHWRPQAATYPVNGGTSLPVFSDFFDLPRVGNHLGAVNP